MTTLSDAVKTVAGRDDPCIGRRPPQIFAEVFEHRGRLWGNGSEVVEGFIDAGRQAGSRYVVAQNSSIDDLCEEASLRDQFAHQMRDVLLPLEHESFLISSSAAKGDDHYFSLASRRRSPCPGRAKKSAPQSHARGIAQEVSAGASDAMADFARVGEISHFDPIRLIASLTSGSPPSKRIGEFPPSAYQDPPDVGCAAAGIAPT